MLLRFPGVSAAVVAVEAGLIRELDGSSRTAVPSSGKGRLAELIVSNDDPSVPSAAVPALDLPGEGWEAPACRRLLMLPPVRWQAKRDARGNSEVGG